MGRTKGGWRLGSGASSKAWEQVDEYRSGFTSASTDSSSSSSGYIMSSGYRSRSSIRSSGIRSSGISRNCLRSHIYPSRLLAMDKSRHVRMHVLPSLIAYVLLQARLQWGRSPMARHDCQTRSFHRQSRGCEKVTRPKAIC